MISNNNSIPESLKGGGKSGALIRSVDWEETPLGPIDKWPSSLCITLSILLNSKSPMFLFWGKEHILFFNDAYLPAFGLDENHMLPMGKPAKEVWAENWDFIKPEIEFIMQGSEHLPEPHLSHLYEKQKSGEIILTYNLSPVKDFDGKVEGILVICNETISVSAREQLKAKKELEILNKEITHLFNSINEGFFSRDITKGQYINLSAGCPKIYGYTIDEFFANPMLWAEVIHPDDRERVFKDDELHKKGEQTYTEYRIYHKDKSVRWIEVKVIPVLTDGLLTRVDGIVNDITVRKQAEQETLKQKELSDSIINSLPGIFYLYDRDGNFLKWNKNFEAESGYSREEISEMHPLDFFSQEDKKLLKRKIAEVFINGFAEVEADFLTKDNKKIKHYLNGRSVEFEGKLCLIGMGIDISQRIIMEETLERNEKMLAHILDSIPQAIFWKDINSIYTGCNKVFAKAAGFNETSSIIGKSDFDLPWKPEEAEKYRVDDQKVMQTNTPIFHMLETQKQANGETVWADTTKIPLANINEKVYGVLGIYEDITERKKAEEERERMTADLIEKNINLRQFSYIVSHNLRSPINKILGLASLFQNISNNVVDPNYRLIKYIVHEATNLDNVVKDLTTIVSFQDLGMNIQQDIFFKNELILIKHALQKEISEAKAHITYDFKNTPFIKSVRGYFYSIMYNLLSNAVKYRNPTRKLKIHLESREDDQYIYLCVKDNGLGIDLEKNRDKIFGLYNRFHDKEIPGKGMGLNLVKTQAETLGGRVEVESEPGQGSLFKVYFKKS